MWRDLEGIDSVLGNGMVMKWYNISVSCDLSVYFVVLELCIKK